MRPLNGRFARAALTFALVGPLLIGSARYADAQDRYPSIPDEVVARTAMHYPESNESAHEVWYDRVRGLGGAYLGVGSMQSYSLASVQRADLVVLVDYDPVVARLHRAMIPLIVGCPDVACLRRRLRPEQSDASLRAIRAALPGGWEAERTLRAFDVHRPLLSRRLDELSELDSWVSRPERYDHIRALARRGRIVARAADLRGPDTIRAASRVASAEGTPFRVVYLSNAEEYFSYDDGFHANMAGLPAEAGTVVLRTYRDRQMPHPPADSAWHYNAQPLADLLRRMSEHGYQHSGWILRDLRHLAPDPTLPAGTSYLGAETPVSTPANGARGPGRWWLQAPEGSPPSPTSSTGPSRLISTVRRAMVPALDHEGALQVRGLELSGTAARLASPALLGDDPLTDEPFVLSGEPAPGTPRRVEIPERNLQALVLDSVARQVLPVLFEAASRPDEVDALRALPVAADLYASYRMRERLQEICVGDARPRTAYHSALRACRAAIQLVRPADNERSFEGWDAVRARLGQHLSSISRAVVRHAPAQGRTSLVESYRRLVGVANGMRPAGE